MHAWTYLSCLLLSLGGLALLDWRYKLAFWHDKRRTIITMSIGMTVFIVWDLLGINLGIFLAGDSRYSLPYRLAPELPIEELFFLCLLCYTTLLLYRAGSRRWPHISS